MVLDLVLLMGLVLGLERIEVGGGGGGGGIVEGVVDVVVRRGGEGERGDEFLCAGRGRECAVHGVEGGGGLLVVAGVLSWGGGLREEGIG